MRKNFSKKLINNNHSYVRQEWMQVRMQKFDKLRRKSCMTQSMNFWLVSAFFKENNHYFYNKNMN